MGKRLQLRELRLNNFGKFHNKTIQLGEGINLIYGENEAGKSTIHSFIRGMLFGIEKLRGRASKEDTYIKYQPWETPGVYNGSMDIKVGDKAYRIFRNFDKNTKSSTVLDLETGRELNLSPLELKDLYGGLTEAGYRNTISIEQLKSRTDQELVEEVRNYITNLSLTKSNEVDVTKALSFLQSKRKELEAQQISSKLASIEEQIVEGLQCERKIDELGMQLNAVEEQLNVLKSKKELVGDPYLMLDGFATLEEYNTYLEQLPVVLEKYRNYAQVTNQKIAFLEKQNALQKQIQEIEETQEEDSQIKKSIREMEQMKAETFSFEEKKKLLVDKEKTIQGGKYKLRLFCLLLAVVSGVAILPLSGKNMILTGVCILLLLGSSLLYLYMSLRMRMKHKIVKEEYSGYEREIFMLKDKEKKLLMKHKVPNEQELKRKQEEALRREIYLEQLLKQWKDNREQVALQEERTGNIKKEIINYMKQSADLFTENQIETQNLNDSTIKLLEEHITQQKQRIARNQETITSEYDNCKLKKEKLSWELGGLESNEDNLLQNQKLRDELIQQKKENEQEIEAIRLATETMNKLSIDIHDGFGQQLNKLVSRATRELTDGKYTEVKIDEKLNIKALYQDNYVLLDKLSSGTIEQMYLALRTSISDLVYGEGAMPILLDDCFSLYDDNRTKAALEALYKEGKRQVLIFTCHNREKDILNQIKADYHYIDLSSDC